MKNKFFIISALALVMLLGYSFGDAYSYPWFARRLVDNCNKCHVAFPKTNDYGWYVKTTGYELPDISYEGLEESPIKRFLRYVPVAVRFKVDAVNSNPSQMEGDVNIRTAQLISGGSIFNNRLSWWFHKHLIENNEFVKLFSGTPHEMWGQYNLRFGKSDATRVSMRYGMSELPLRFSPSKTDVSEMGYAIYNAMLGENPLMLSMPQYGAVLKGVKLGGDSYNKVQSTFDLAFVSGTGDFSSYDFTKVFGRVGTTVGNTMVGAFSYLGSLDLPMAMHMDDHVDEPDAGAHVDEPMTAGMTVSDNFIRFGLDFDANLTPQVNVYGLGLYGRDSNPLALETQTSGHYYGGFLGVDYCPTERFMLSWRYDAVRFGNLPAVAHDEHAQDGTGEEGEGHTEEHAAGGGHMHGEMVSSNTDAMVVGANVLLPIPNYQMRLTSEYRLGFRGLGNKLIVGLQFAL